jgi:hypothetical protein
MFSFEKVFLVCFELQIQQNRKIMKLGIHLKIESGPIEGIHSKSVSGCLL